MGSQKTAGSQTKRKKKSRAKPETIKAEKEAAKEISNIAQTKNGQALADIAKQYNHNLAVKHKAIMFAQAYVGEAKANQTEAATLAGLGHGKREQAQTEGSRLMLIPMVQEIIAELQDQTRIEHGITTAEVVGTYREIIERCMEVKQLEIKGVTLPVFIFDAKNAIAANKGLAMVAGLERTNINLSGGVGVTTGVLKVNGTQSKTEWLKAAKNGG